MPQTCQSATEWLRVIQSEYREMPGLHLTKPQVRRLWGIDQPTCDGILDALVAANFLKKTTHDGYVLASCER